MSAKALFYSAAKAFGLFAVSSRITQKHLRILCYHGFSFQDEFEFRPQLFHTAEVFRKRLEFLQCAGYRTISLTEAETKLQNGTLESRDIVITIDDGFYGVFAIAAPLLEQFGFSATVYVTTYYVQKKTPVFRLALQYLFWKSSHTQLDCTGFADNAPSAAVKGIAGDATEDRLIAYGETKLSEDERQSMLRTIAQRLDVDYNALVASRRLSLMTESEIKNLSDRGFDIQLHTHRHQLPEDESVIQREIEENRRVLAPLTKGNLTHFCYPSGVWSPVVLPMLRAQGITTATTCDLGLNNKDISALAWRRFLDFHATPQIVFEADLCGFSELPRKILGRPS